MMVEVVAQVQLRLEPPRFQEQVELVDKHIGDLISAMEPLQTI